MRLFSLTSGGKKRLSDLSEAQILALAISSEEEDAGIYRAYGQAIEADYPATAAILADMARQEDEHRRNLLDLYQERFGPNVIPIRREHVAGFAARKPLWLFKTLSLGQIRDEAHAMEKQAEAFYRSALHHVSNVSTRKLLGDLAEAEANHQHEIIAAQERHLDPQSASTEEAQEKRQFILTWVQPGLAGLMDGSVSTLAPIFATAFATQDTHTTFLVGLAASIGAGISMGFTEAASDDGAISGRGSPLKRGIAAGVMTTIGGLGHALPYLIADFRVATTVAFIVVFIELWAIVWIQNKYMQTPFWRATLQVVIGGALVFAAGIIIGNG